MLQCKYIVQRDPLKIFIFDQQDRHDFTAQRFGIDLNDVRSAGYVFLSKSKDGEDLVICKGGSTSLQVPSDEEGDAKLFRETFLNG